MTIRWSWCAQGTWAKRRPRSGSFSCGGSSTRGSPWMAALVLSVLTAPLFSCGGASTPGVNPTGQVATQSASLPSASPLDCQSSQCISLPVVPQTTHRFQFWYEVCDPGTTPAKLAWADVVIGINGILPPVAEPSTGVPETLVYVTYYQDTDKSPANGVAQTFIKTDADIPLLALEVDGVMQMSDFKNGNPGWDVLCDNSTELRNRAFAHLATVTKAGYGGLFVDNAAQAPQTCTSTSHQHLNLGQRSDDAYLTLLGDVQAQLK